jgi:hypothetical protein
MDTVRASNLTCVIVELESNLWTGTLVFDILAVTVFVYLTMSILKPTQPPNYSVPPAVSPRVKLAGS